MITFNTEQVKKYGKVLQSAIGKQDPYSESVFLDFENNRIQFKSDVDDGGNEFFGNLKVDFEGEHVPFWVDGLTFLHLCRSFETIKVENYTFTAESTGENFELKRMESDEFDSSLSFNDFTFENSIPIPYETIGALSKVSGMIKADSACPNANIGELDEYTVVYGGTPQQYFEVKIPDLSCNVEFSIQAIHIISNLSNSNEIVKFNYDNGAMYLNSGDEIEIITSYNLASTEIPYDDEEKFRGIFMHPTTFTVKKSEVLGALKFLDPFMRDSNKVVSLNVSTDTLTIKPELAGYKADKKVSAENVSSEIDGLCVKVPSEYIKDALNIVSGEDIIFRVSAENKKAGVCVQNLGGSELNVFAVDVSNA